jgi:hypothetical protein
VRVALLAAVLSLAAAGCADTAVQAEVHGMRLRPNASDYPTLSGYVVNLSERPLASADVAVTLYDEDNRPIGDAMVQVRDVPPGDSARFERRLDRAATGARLRHLTAN